MAHLLWFHRALRGGMVGASLFLSGCGAGLGHRALPAPCGTLPAKEDQAPWHLRVDEDCVRTTGAEGTTITATPGRVRAIDAEGRLIWEHELSYCSKLRGLAPLPDGAVAVSCTQRFFIVDASKLRFEKLPNSFIHSAPLATERLVLVTSGSKLHAYTFEGEPAWTLTLTEDNVDAQIPALARDRDGNILVSLYLGGEVDLGWRHEPGKPYLIGRNWAPHLMTVSLDGHILKSVPTDTPNFRWPRAHGGG